MTVLGSQAILMLVAFVLVAAAACVASPISIQEAKRLDDGAQVELSGKIVTAAFSGYYYLSEPDHSCGVRVLSSKIPLAGATASVSGTMATSESYERQIVASSATFDSYLPPVISNKQVGGGDDSYDEFSGAGQRGAPLGASLPNNVGELVRTTGTVTMGKPGDAADFPIDDGTHVALLVVVPPGVTNPGYGAQVTVTGVSSLMEFGGVPRRAVLVRSSQDLQVNQPPPECKYGGEMVYVPAGECIVGVDLDYEVSWTMISSPRTHVYMDGYWVGKYEVTVGEYRKFMEAGGYDNREYWSDEGWWWRLGYRTNAPWRWVGDSPAYDDYPVTGVSPYEMDAYCNWAGVRRTTEVEWEKAASWDPVAQHQRTYPWGDVWDPNKCNNRDMTIPPYGGYPVQVGSFPDGASYYGCEDIAGNVFEWCKGFSVNDWYSHTPAIGWIDPQGSERPDYDYYNCQNYRGGSYWPGERDQRPAHRFGQLSQLFNADIGFRVTR